MGLIVHGDLIVEGTFRDYEDPQSLCIVCGNLEATTIDTAGELEVQGDLVATHLIGRGNHHSTRVYGKARARLYYPEEHAFSYAKKPEFELAVGYCRDDTPLGIKAPTYLQAWNLLRDACFPHGDPSDYPEDASSTFFDYDYKLMRKLLDEGESLFRDSK